MSDLVSFTRELAIDTKRLVTAHVEELMAPLQAKIEMLEHRIAALDAQPKSLDYAGVWEPDIVYTKNQGVSDRGKLWICLQRTSSRPGDPTTARSGNWRR
jgi:hypothetical protein